jgi:sarcosine oxidase subunit gamma
VVEVQRLSALAQVQALSTARFALSERRLGALAQVNGTPANIELAGDGLLLHRLGPTAWLVEAHDSEPPALLQHLRERLASSEATVTDLSHALSVLRLSGSAALEVLASGCALDLERLAPGASVPTQTEQFSVQLRRLSEDTWDIYIYRSFALTLWQWLMRASAEYR